jgi:hypothetical protein
MAVYVNNITINTGEYFSRDFYLDNIDGTPLNLTGYTAASQVRKHPESVNATADFKVGFIDRANGRIRVSLATTTTTLIKPGRYVWDMMFTEANPQTNSGVWSTLEANNPGSYRGHTNVGWSSFMNTYAYSRVPQSGSLSSQPDPYGVKTDSYTVFFPYDGVYQIDANADNVGSITINSTTFTANIFSATNPGVGTISLTRGNHTVTLTQQNLNNGQDDFADNPVGIAASISYVGGTGYGKKSIVIEGNVLATEDITPSCIVTSYANEEIGFILEANGFGSRVTGTSITINDINDYGTVRLGFVSGCQTLANAVSLIRNEVHKNSLVEYLQMGGVIWVNNEWFTQNGCGDEAGMNEILTGLGSEIRQANQDITTGPLFMDRSTDGPVVASNFPTELYSNASGTFTGGTPVYTVGANTTVAYEKIGSGILYVSADTNTFDADTFNGKPTDFATVGPQIYSALRSLVLNS